MFWALFFFRQTYLWQFNSIPIFYSLSPSAHFHFHISALSPWLCNTLYLYEHEKWINQELIIMLKRCSRNWGKKSLQRAGERKLNKDENETKLWYVSERNGCNGNKQMKWKSENKQNQKNPVEQKIVNKIANNEKERVRCQVSHWYARSDWKGAGKVHTDIMDKQWTSILTTINYWLVHSTLWRCAFLEYGKIWIWKFWFLKKTYDRLKNFNTLKRKAERFQEQSF